MPNNQVIFNNGSNGEKGYRSSFSHQNEVSSPGYYAVHLDDTKIDVSLSVSKRSGIHQYVFPKGSKQVVILDLAHRDRVLDAEVSIESNQLVHWTSLFKSLGQKNNVYFLTLPFPNLLQMSRFLMKKQPVENVKAAFEFDESTSNILEIEVGISAVDEAGARKKNTA